MGYPPAALTHTGSKSVACTWSRSSIRQSAYASSAMQIFLRDCIPSTFPREHGNSGMTSCSFPAMLGLLGLLRISPPAFPDSVSRTVAPSSFVVQSFWSFPCTLSPAFPQSESDNQITARAYPSVNSIQYSFAQPHHVLLQNEQNEQLHEGHVRSLSQPVPSSVGFGTSV